jgi:hypothetical protein
MTKTDDNCSALDTRNRKLDELKVSFAHCSSSLTVPPRSLMMSMTDDHSSSLDARRPNQRKTPSALPFLSQLPQLVWRPHPFPWTIPLSPLTMTEDDSSSLNAQRGAQH